MLKRFRFGSLSDMAVLRGFLVLLLFQVAGTWLQGLLHIPIPGPVLGMALLAAWMLLRPRQQDAAVVQVSDGLLGWLGLLFVPAGVGIVASFDLLRGAWTAVIVGLVVSTLLTLLVTAGVVELFARRRRA